jgi:hypothetical protein
MIDYLSIKIVPENQSEDILGPTEDRQLHDNKPCLGLAQYSTILHMNEPSSRSFDASISTMAYIGPTALSSVAESMSLYQFLKRAGLGQRYTKFTSGGITTVEQLNNLSKDKTRAFLHFELTGSLFGLSQGDAIRLADILTRTETEAGHLRNFELLDHSRLQNLFVIFYSEPIGEVAKGPDGSLCLIPPRPSGREGRVRFDGVSLERWGRAYASRACDQGSGGTGQVSAIEVMAHLERYRASPQGALDSISDELLHPPPPVPLLDSFALEVLSEYSWGSEGLGATGSDASTTSSHLSVSRSTSSTEASLHVGEAEGGDGDDDILGLLTSNMMKAMNLS